MDWYALETHNAESRAARRARWSRVKLVAYPIGIVIGLVALYVAGKI